MGPTHIERPLRTPSELFLLQGDINTDKSMFGLCKLRKGKWWNFTCA